MTRQWQGNGECSVLTLPRRLIVNFRQVVVVVVVSPVSAAGAGAFGEQADGEGQVEIVFTAV